MLTWAHGVSQLSHCRDDEAPTESQGLSGAHEGREWPSPVVTGGHGRGAGRFCSLDGAGRVPRAGDSGGTRAPACPARGSQLRAWGRTQETPDRGGRAPRELGRPLGTREGSSWEGEPRPRRYTPAVGRGSLDSCSKVLGRPGSARAPALGLVGTPPRCLCTPSSGRGFMGASLEPQQ